LSSEWGWGRGSRGEELKSGKKGLSKFLQSKNTRKNKIVEFKGIGWRGGARRTGANLFEKALGTNLGE